MSTLPLAPPWPSPLPEPPEPTQYACPFCGVLSEVPPRGPHFASHRKAGDTPKPLNGEVYESSDGFWRIRLTIADTGDQVRVPVNLQGQRNKAAAERALAKFVDHIANGAPPKSKGKKATKAQFTKVVSEVLTDGDRRKTPPAPPAITDDAIIGALIRLTGADVIPAKQFTLVSEWVTVTRALVKEIVR